MGDNDIVEEFSPKYFYYNRRPKNIERGIGGMSPISVGRITKTAGAVSEILYPYDDVKDTEGTDAIPEPLKTMGADYGRDNYANDQFFQLKPSFYWKEDDFRHAVQSYLAIYGVGIISVPVYGYGCDFWNKREGTPFGRHSMLVDGYDENGLHIRNSWGQNWCQNGFSSMTWSDAFDRAFALYFWKKPIDGRMKDRLRVKNIKVQKDCLMEENVAYDGGNLETVRNVDSAEKCGYLCYETPRCLTWTFERRTCYLKDKYRYKKRMDDASISGLPCSTEICRVSSTVANERECLCPGSGTKCNANQFCYDEKCHDFVKWKVILARGYYAKLERFQDLPKGRWSTIDLGGGEINRRIKRPGAVRIIRRTCNWGCWGTHKTIYYKRITDDSRIDYRNLFVYQWTSHHNILNRDFKMYSSLEDLKADRNAWRFCNYNGIAVSRPIAFPYDCGKDRYSGHQWNSWPNLNGWARIRDFMFEYFDDSMGPLE